MLEQLRANPITVDFDLDVATPGISGRVAFKRNSYDEAEDEDGYGIEFFCGPEVSPGTVSDCVFVDDKLMELFDDIGCISIGEAENFHMTGILPDISVDDLWQVIEERLIRCGAVAL